MSKRVFKQVLGANFGGIDGQSSAIEVDGDTANRAVNYEPSVGNSLRGRVGCQTTGAHGFFAIFPYRYSRTTDQYDIVYQTAAGAYPTQTPGLATTKTAADGASIEKLIAINDQIWMLDTMNVTITQTNAGTYTWYSYVSGSNINFNIKKDGTSILDTSLGDGVTSATSIYSLLGTIDALADLAVSRTTRGTCPPFAIVNGNQTTVAGASASYGTRYTVTVDAGHNFQAGDIVTFPTLSTLYGGVVISTTATTIVYVGQQVSVLDDAVLGYMGQPATNFPISTVSSESSGALTISFPYWRLIPEGDASGNAPYYGAIFSAARTTWSNRSSGSFFAPANAVNLSGNLYIAASATVGSSGATGYESNLIKLDGRQASRAGLPKVSVSVISGGAGALTGAYRYRAYLRRYDAQGNIFDGPVHPAGGTITFAANNGLFTAIISTTPANTTVLYTNATGFCVRSCYKHTTESPASGASFYVDSSTAGVGDQAFIQPGDRIFLTDSTAQTTGLFTDAGLAVAVGTLHKTVCTAYTAQVATISPTISSIKVEDSSGYQINANTEISTGLTMVVLRTTAGGNTYYELCEVPVTGYASTFSAYDNVTDAVLVTKEQFVEPESGKEHDPPPACTLVCEHQGGLVVARGPTTPNTVSVSTAEGIEYFPTASNSFDVPSTQSGAITAIASDTADRLAVFKERAYYDVIGDIDGGAFSVNVVNEGDYGVTSHASLCRVRGTLVGLSKNGLVTIQDGSLGIDAMLEEFNARLINQPYQYAWATGVNDYFNRSYILTIPQVSGEPVGYTLDYSRNKGVRVLERSYATKIDQAGGAAMVGDTLYHLSQTSPYGVYRRLRRFSSDSPSGNGDGDSFIDNTGAISYIYESVPINFGEPAQLKTPIRIRVWSVPNDYVVEGWVPFSMLVESGASALAQYVGGSSPNAASTTITFSADTDGFKDAKLPNCKTHFYIVRLTTNTIRTAPFLTGYEIMFDANYPKEDLIK